MEVTQAQSGPSAPYSPFSAGGVEDGSLGKEDFMQLLVAQLANQDPMNPTDSTEFTAQLAQFSSLEQLVNVNNGLQMLAITQTAGTSAQVMNFIGKEVEFAGDSLQLDGASGTDVRFQMGDSAASVTIVIKDEAGNVVKTIEAGPQSEGSASVSWNGTDDDGLALDAGTYTYTVTAKDAAGADVAVDTRGHGTVTGVVFDKGYPELVLSDGRKARLGDIFEVFEGKSSSSGEKTAERTAE